MMKQSNAWKDPNLRIYYVLMGFGTCRIEMRKSVYEKSICSNFDGIVTLRFP